MNALVKSDPKNGMLNNLANRYEMDPEEFRTTIAHTVMPQGTTEAEFVAFLMVCNTYTLNPILREIYAFPKKGGGIVPIVSIDGWIRLVNQHPQLKGFETEAVFDDAGKLFAYTCRIWRKDREMPTVITEYLSECIRSTDPWKMAHRMLRHKSLIQCARYAFGFAGIYDEDEGSDFAEPSPVAARRAATPPKPSGTGVIDVEAREVKQDAAARDPAKSEAAAAPAEEKKETRSPATHGEGKPGSDFDQSDPAGREHPETEQKAADPAPRKRRPNGWSALFEAAKLVIEDGVFTKDVKDPKSVGDKAEPGDYADADLVLENNVITKQPGQATADELLAKFKAGFEQCDSIDSLTAAAHSFEAEFKSLKGEDEKRSIALFREHEARIKAADAAAKAGETKAPAGEQQQDDGFPGDKPSSLPPVGEAGAAAGADSGVAEKDPTDMTAAEYIAYATAYIQGATAFDPMKKAWFAEAGVRGVLEENGDLSEKDRQALRSLYKAKEAELKG